MSWEPRGLNIRSVCGYGICTSHSLNTDGPTKRNILMWLGMVLSQDETARRFSWEKTEDQDKQKGWNGTVYECVVTRRMSDADSGGADIRFD